MDELAKYLGVEARDILETLKEMGEQVRSPTSTLPPATIDRLSHRFAKGFGSSPEDAESQPPEAAPPKPGPPRGARNPFAVRVTPDVSKGQTAAGQQTPAASDNSHRTDSQTILAAAGGNPSVPSQTNIKITSEAPTSRETRNVSILRRTKAVITQRRKNGDWGARSEDGIELVIPQDLLASVGAVSPRSGVRIEVSVISTEAGHRVIGVTRSDDQFVLTPVRGALNELLLSDDTQTRILVVGRTGVGKSSTINSLVGANVADIGHFEPTTAELRFYNGRIAGAHILIADTPGFADTRTDHSNDRKYVELIARRMGEVDLLLFVTGLDDPRVEKGEHDTIQILTEEFSPAIWDRALVILTRSDRVTRANFAKVLEGRTAVLRRAFRDIIGQAADSMPFVPVSNERMRTPDRKHWLGELWMHMLVRLSDQGFESLAVAALSRLAPTEPNHGSHQTVSSQDSPDPPDQGGGTSPAPTSSWPYAEAASNMPIPTEVATAAYASLDVGQVPPVDSPGGALEWATVFDAQPLIDATVPALSIPVRGDFVRTRGEIQNEGIRVIETDFILGRGDAIKVTSQQAAVINNIVNERAPGLMQKLAAAGAWVLKKIFGFLGGV